MFRYGFLVFWAPVWSFHILSRAPRTIAFDPSVARPGAGVFWISFGFSLTVFPRPFGQLCGLAPHLQTPLMASSSAFSSVFRQILSDRVGVRFCPPLRVLGHSSREVSRLHFNSLVFSCGLPCLSELRRSCVGSFGPGSVGQPYGGCVHLSSRWYSFPVSVSSLSQSLRLVSLVRFTSRLPFFRERTSFWPTSSPEADSFRRNRYSKYFQCPGAFLKFSLLLRS